MRLSGTRFCRHCPDCCQRLGSIVQKWLVEKRKVPRSPGLQPFPSSLQGDSASMSSTAWGNFQGCSTLEKRSSLVHRGTGRCGALGPSPLVTLGQSLLPSQPLPWRPRRTQRGPAELFLLPFPQNPARMPERRLVQTAKSPELKVGAWPWAPSPAPHPGAHAQGRPASAGVDSQSRAPKTRAMGVTATQVNAPHSAVLGLRFPSGTCARWRGACPPQGTTT